MSTPTATLYIQDVTQVDADLTDAKVPAVVLRSVSGNESGAHFEATVEYATDDGAIGAAIMSVTIANVTRAFFDRFKPGAFIRLEAGYLDSELAPPQTIFYGVIDAPVPYRQGGEKWMRIDAIAHPTAFYSTAVVPSNFPANSVSIGELIEHLCSKVGIFTTLSPELYEVTYPGTYSGGGLSLAKQIGQLMTKAHGITGNEYIEFPDNGDPYHIIIMPSTKFDTIDRRVLPQDLSSVNVQSAGFTSERKERELIPITNPESLEAYGTISIESEFRNGITVTRKLDPRITTGLHILYQDEFLGEGVALVKSVRHMVGGSSWETSYEASFLEEDLEA